MNTLYSIFLQPYNSPSSVTGRSVSLNDVEIFLKHIYPKAKQTYGEIGLLFHRTDFPDFPEHIQSWNQRFIPELTQLCKRHNYDVNQCKFLFGTQSPFDHTVDLSWHSVFCFDFYLVKQYALAPRVTDVWNHRRKQGLAIMGKLYRPQRARAAKHLIEHQGFAGLDWSMRLPTPDDPLYHRTQQTLQDLAITQEQIEPWCRELPGDDVIENTFTNTGYPYNSEFYTRNSYSVVIETLVEEPCTFITEKTAKPIAHAHPFVGVFHPWCLQRLEQLGFYTYTQYYLEPGQDYDPNWVLDNFTHCVQKFAHNTHTQKRRVQHQTRHNQEQLARLGRRQLRKLSPLTQARILVRQGHTHVAQTTFKDAVLGHLEYTQREAPAVAIE